MIRGDLGKIEIGRYTYIGPNTVLRPPFKIFGKSYDIFFLHFSGKLKRHQLIKHWFVFMSLISPIERSRNRSNTNDNRRPCLYRRRSSHQRCKDRVVCKNRKKCCYRMKNSNYELSQGRRCILNDCCVILDGTVLPPDTVVRSYSIVGGCPGNIHYFVIRRCRC